MCIYNESIFRSFVKSIYFLLKYLQNFFELSFSEKNNQIERLYLKINENSPFQLRIFVESKNKLM